MMLKEVKERIKKAIEENKRINISGISDTALSFLYSHILREIKRPNIIILPTKKQAKKIIKELNFFLPDIPIYEFPPYDISPFSGLNPHREIISNRIASLFLLLNEESPILVTSLDAILLKTVEKKVFLDFIDYIEKDEEFERDLLIKKLEQGGYQRVPVVEDIGDYAVRGNVIDIFPPIYQSPVRLEFFGDFVESIRYFDPLTQMSNSKTDSIILLPCSEIILNEKTLKRARSLGRVPFLENSLHFSGKEAWLFHFYENPSSIFEYAPENAIITIYFSHSLDSTYKRIRERFERDVERFRREAAERGEPFPETDGIVLELEEIKQELKKFQVVELESSLVDKETDLIEIPGNFQPLEDIEIRIPERGRVSLAPLAEKVDQWKKAKGKVVIVTRTSEQGKRLKEILKNYNVEVDGFLDSWKDIPEKSGIYICKGNIPNGFLWQDIGLCVISEDEIFGKKKEVPEDKKRSKLIKLTDIGQFRVGDLVVHEEHGIGRYMGLKKVEVNNRINEYVVIEYAGNSKLYIPADRVSILQKYIGVDDKEPKLDQLGGRSWDIAKKRAKSSIRKIAKQLVELYAIRQSRKGFAFSPPDHIFREFEATFEHEETPDQIKAIEDVIRDMTSERPMDRLICGDVGFGKTEVAIRAAFKAVMDGKQVAVVVPTTLLAEQHYRTFKKRMEPYSIRVEMLSRFKSRSEQKRIIAETRSGKVDVIIGTHRILQKDIKFSDLGLLIIDEEQKFGVRQKEQLKRYRATIDVLSLAATPIPRTLHMALLGVRDISIIETPPKDRLSIKTHISYYDEDLIKKAIRFELERGGQVFFVHNRVQTIYERAEIVKELVPEARIEVAHGQMKEEDLEKTMLSFLNREIDVLVCTSIIESGLDIPSVNTIIIDGVEKMGLSQIYQLRGRVGRSKERAYAYLLISDPSSITPDGEKRLKALMDFSRLGAGLQLAMHDLRIRGGGNILGYAQSGHISEIGYELYVKLIEQTIAELKGEEWHEEINPEINIDVPAYIPEKYIMDADIRLNIYRRLSMLSEEGSLLKIKEELLDRFGDMPDEVRNLFEIMGVRIILKKIGVKRLDVGSDGIVLTFLYNGYVNPERLKELILEKPRIFRFLSPDKLKINAKINLPSDLSKIKEVLQELREKAT